ITGSPSTSGGVGSAKARFAPCPAPSLRCPLSAARPSPASGGGAVTHTAISSPACAGGRGMAGGGGGTRPARGVTARPGHIGESSACPLEPPEAEPCHGEARGQVKHRSRPVRRLTPDEDAPRVPDNRSQRVQEKQNAIIFGQRLNRIEYWG